MGVFMNLPNKLTVLRVCLIPVFVVAYWWTALPDNYLIALVIFALASLTDLLDGHIARSRGLITDFGKLMDPLADKLLVMSAMICLIGDMVPGWAVIIILAREFLVTSIRLVAAGKGMVLAADKWGKVKTVTQMLWLCYDLLAMWIFRNLGVFDMSPSSSAGIELYIIQDVLMAVVLFFTIFSGWNYVWKNRELFDDA